MKKLFLLFFFANLFLFNACSTVNTTNTAKEPENEVYIFDDVSNLEEKIEEEPVSLPQVKETDLIVKTVYIVQVGAFSTKERAVRFKQENSFELSYELKISYSSRVGLFVVQLPEFETREEAETVRNQLRKKRVFSDAFILDKEK